jgi:hypothetical protein
MLPLSPIFPSDNPVIHLLEDTGLPLTVRASEELLEITDVLPNWINPVPHCMPQ